MDALRAGIQPRAIQGSIGDVQAGRGPPRLVPGPEHGPRGPDAGVGESLVQRFSPPRVRVGEVGGEDHVARGGPGGVLGDDVNQVRRIATADRDVGTDPAQIRFELTGWPADQQHLAVLRRGRDASHQGPPTEAALRSDVDHDGDRWAPSTGGPSPDGPLLESRSGVRLSTSERGRGRGQLGRDRQPREGSVGPPEPERGVNERPLRRGEGQVPHGLVLVAAVPQIGPYERRHFRCGRAGNPNPQGAEGVGGVLDPGPGVINELFVAGHYDGHAVQGPQRLPQVALAHGQRPLQREAVAGIQGSAHVVQVAQGEDDDRVLAEHPAPEGKQDAVPGVLPHPGLVRIALAEAVKGATPLLGECRGQAVPGEHRWPPPGAAHGAEQLLVEIGEPRALPVPGLVPRPGLDQVLVRAHRHAEQVDQPGRGRGAAAVHPDYEYVPGHGSTPSRSRWAVMAPLALEMTSSMAAAPVRWSWPEGVTWRW